MASLRHNIAASYAGQIWVAIVGIAFIPAYLRHLGPEAFGLIAFMFGVQAASLVFDMGVSTYVSREIARRSHVSAQSGTIKPLVRTAEWIAWPTALLILVVLSASSPFIAGQWLSADRLDVPTTTNALHLVALAVALLWPTSLYNACLTGLELQPKLNLALAIFATLRYAGVLPVMYLSGTGLLGFLAWHAGLAGIQTAVTAGLVWRNLPAADRDIRFTPEELTAGRAFALGILTITGLAVVFTQLDRFMISALRPLEDLGWYAVALSISAGLARLVQPVFNAAYPRLSGLAGSGKVREMGETYRVSSQLVAVVVTSAAAVICIHAESVLWIWTGDRQIADRVAVPLGLLVAGTAVSGILCIPYALQLANGWTRLAALGNLVTVLVALPLYYFGVQNHGMTGAAASWLAINLAYMAITLPIMHRRILPGQLGSWLCLGVLPPVLVAATFNLVVRSIGFHPERDLAGLALLAVVSIATLAAALVAAPATRELLFAKLASR